MTKTQINERTSRKQTLPSVVQLGFSGSRQLFDGVLADEPKALKLCNEVEEWLERRIAKLHHELQLDDNQFLVGISQIACGGDTIFSKVCKKQSIPQRVFLPDHRQTFFGAVESHPGADFTPRQRAESEALLESGHIIQERVVGISADRDSRFEETNVEIMRVSDAIICLLRADSVGKKGGTRELMDRAVQRGMPVLEIQVAEKNDSFEIVKDQWHNAIGDSNKRINNLPDDIASLPFPPLVSGQDPIPKGDEYCNALSKLAANQAKGKQRLFRRAAGLIIVTHIAATVLALIALSVHSNPLVDQASTHSADKSVSHWIVLGLLIVELVLLAAGFRVHQLLHYSHAVQEWAIARVVRELVRSMQAIGNRHLYLEHLFRLPLPSAYRPFLRTLSILHLHATWSQRTLPWQPQRDQYILKRFDDPTNGQFHFFEKALRKDRRLLIICQFAFTSCSILAMAATMTKLFLVWNHFEGALFLAILGTFAVTLPVLAVGGLSWAAAVDCEARVETFEETLAFLRRQRPFLVQAASGPEFDRLLVETETVLLGEVTNWYSRRANKGVS